MQEATTQFRGSNCFEERRGFMGNEEKKNITIADVAEALGVSKTTVSRAISGKGRIGQETRDRVLKYIEEHDYKPNVIAKGLAQSKTYNLCVVMPGEYDVVDLTFFQECLFGIQEIAGIMEYDILLSICKNNDISSLERIISNRKVDGVILMRTFVEDRQIEYLQEKKVPFVTIGSSNYTGHTPPDKAYQCTPYLHFHWRKTIVLTSVLHSLSSTEKGLHSHQLQVIIQ